jgi:xanthine dehydrogenase small subunit
VSSLYWVGDGGAARVKFRLNGAQVHALGVDHHTTLLQWLRSSGLTGSKEGCAEGECGACAVAIVGRDARGRARLEPVNSCLVPLPSVDGRSIITVEGVAPGAHALHPVQQMMVDAGGSQCGYCTPGFVVSLYCEYYRPGRDGYDPESIGGNLCRCTGYRPIVDVARALPAPAADDPVLALLAGPAAASFEGAQPIDETAASGCRFLRPTDLASALALLASTPGAVPIAGGTDLMVYANQRYDRFPTLLSLEALPELRRFEIGPQEIVLGAGLPLSEIEERVSAGAGADLDMLAQLLPLFSSRLIRNRATLGGNLATASPIGDSSPALLALDAEVTVARAAAGRSTWRRIALGDLFAGYRRTTLARDELIVSVHLPRPLPALQRFYKVSKRVLDDISTVAAAFALDLSPAGQVQRLRIAYGGVAATPLRAHAAEAAAHGRPWTRDTVARAAVELDGIGSPMTDHRGSAAYRRAMMGKLLEKFFADTRGGAGVRAAGTEAAP